MPCSAFRVKDEAVDILRNSMEEVGKVTLQIRWRPVEIMYGDSIHENQIETFSRV
jgi:hypothetical protein